MNIEVDKPWLMLGDCLGHMESIPDGSIDLVVTDPPYRVVGGGTSSALAKRWGGSILKNNDGKIFKHNELRAKDCVHEIFRILKDGGEFYVMTNVLNLKETIEVSEKSGFRLHNILLWEKNTCTANRWYMKNVEFTLYFYKGKAKKINFPGSKQTFKSNNPVLKHHPTEKPIELMSHYILNSSNMGDIILDPFMGSGSTGLAAFAHGRKFIGIEKHEPYFEVARHRINKAIGEKLSSISSSETIYESLTHAR